MRCFLLPYHSPTDTINKLSISLFQNGIFLNLWQTLFRRTGGSKDKTDVSKARKVRFV
jgi:hypothetical protein